MMVRLVGSRFFRVLASSTLFALPPSRRSLHTRPTERLAAMSSSSALLFVVICLHFPPAQLCAGGDRHDALYPVSRWRRPCGRGRGRRWRAPVGTERTLIRRERTSERACELRRRDGANKLRGLEEEEGAEQGAFLAGNHRYQKQKRLG